MITENRLTTYINSLAQGDGSLIETIAENAVKNRVPIIRRETASLLKTMVTLFGATSVTIALKDDGDAGGSEQDP